MGTSERRGPGPRVTRGPTRLLWDLVFGSVRWTARHARNAYTTFGLLVVGGIIIAGFLSYGFAHLAAEVMAGDTTKFDEAAMRYVGEHQVPWLRKVMVEITMLGTGIVVAMIVGVAGLFLWLYNYRQSALLLLVATIGGIILNSLLKLGFDRDRPRIFEWGTHASTSSFPSGHAMSAAIVYPTVAYLAYRLHKTRLSRLVTLFAAILLVGLISFSRIYLGVHYPTDVAAGMIVGLAWSAFCMVTLEVAQLYARRNAPAMVEGEPLPNPGPATATAEAPKGVVAVVKGVEAGEREKELDDTVPAPEPGASPTR